LKTPRRIAALAMVMALCLLVYTLAQRTLRQSLAQQGQTVPNQLGKPTTTPTMRWIFQPTFSRLNRKNVILI
jgi:transposase